MISKTPNCFLNSRALLTRVHNLHTAYLCATPHSLRVNGGPIGCLCLLPVIDKLHYCSMISPPTGHVLSLKRHMECLLAASTKCTIRAHTSCLSVRKKQSGGSQSPISNEWRETGVYCDWRSRANRSVQGEEDW